MALDTSELQDKYKGLPMWGRLAIMAVVGLLPGAYIYYTSYEELDVRMGEAQTKRDTLRTKFEADRKAKVDLPKREEIRAFTEEQLAKVKRNLPEGYRIEEILEKAATIAKETGVEFSQFDPRAETCTQKEDFQYKEAPIGTRIRGRYGQVAAFLDRVVHLETTIFIRSLNLNRDQPVVQNAANANQETMDRTNREAVRTAAQFDMVLYRSLAPGEPCTPEGGNPGEVVPGVPAVPQETVPGEAGAPAPA